jgi:hypothetical protein
VLWFELIEPDMHTLSLGLLLISFVTSSPAATRENPLFDAYYTSIGFAAENARLNNYSILLKDSSGSRGLIVVYAKSERTAKSAQARARRAVRYLVKNRGVNPKRIAWRYERSCGREEILLYLFYPNETDPLPDPKCMRAHSVDHGAPNKSLDASGGGVFRIITGPAMLE